MNTLSNFIIPVNDELRLNKLNEYQILDTHQEDTFDKIALVASQLFGTAYAFVTFVDEDRVFFKSNISDFDGNVAPREKIPCSLAILQDTPTIYYDTLEDSYLKDGPLIGCAGGIRYYVGMPLKTPEGYLIGTLCVADNKPRNVPVTDMQMEMLKSLSEVIINKLESRLRYKKLLKSQTELMNITLHEIKNPLASIKLANEVIMKDPSRIENMGDMIKQSVNRIQEKLNDLLKYSEAEEEQLKLNIQETDLREILESLVESFELQAQRKQQRLLLDFKENLPKIYIDKAKITDVFHNLLSNAIKYSYYNSDIQIAVRRKKKSVKIGFSDSGQGLSTDDIGKLFIKFAKLSAQPTGKETSNGMGLSICKSLVEMHNGKIYAKSEGKDKGCCFIVKLPLVHEIA